MMLRRDALGVCERRVSPGSLRRVLAVLLIAMLLAAGLLAAGCYSRVVRKEGIGNEGQRVYRPNAPEPGTPWFPWFNDAEEDKDDD